ncbi:hypothetical protein Tco_1266942 [Tanacetum coccineum]
METIHVQFDELTEHMAPTQLSTGPAPTFLMPGQISSGLVPNPVPATPYAPPTNKELEILFQPMFDEYMEPPRVERPVSPAPAVPAPVHSAGTPSSTTIDQDAPSPSPSLTCLLRNIVLKQHPQGIVLTWRIYSLTTATENESIHSPENGHEEYEARELKRLQDDETRKRICFKLT